MPIKLVTQANLTDCGLACVAMVTGKSLDTVLRVAIKECGYPKDGPHTTTDENLFKLLDHFGIKYGKKQKVKTVEALPPLAIMETRKMPSTGNSHLVVFERTAEGDEHALDPGWWLKQQVRSDWNRIKLDTFIPIHLNEPTTKAAKKKTDTNAEPQPGIEQKTSPQPKKKNSTSASKKPKVTKPKTTAHAEEPDGIGAEPSDGTATNPAADNTALEPAGSVQEWNDVA